jgi:hypothetical protein
VSFLVLWLTEEVLTLLFFLHHDNGDFSVLMKDMLLIRYLKCCCLRGRMWVFCFLGKIFVLCTSTVFFDRGCMLLFLEYNV